MFRKAGLNGDVGDSKSGSARGSLESSADSKDGDDELRGNETKGVLGRDGHDSIAAASLPATRYRCRTRRRDRDGSRDKKRENRPKTDEVLTDDRNGAKKGHESQHKYLPYVRRPPTLHA